MRHLVELLDESRPLVAQVVHDMAVVNDLVPDVDGRAVLQQRAIDNLDRSHNARTKAAGLGKNDSHKGANSDDRRRGSRRPDSRPDRPNLMIINAGSNLPASKINRAF